MVENKQLPDHDEHDSPVPDEKMGVMVYGNLRITDVDTGEVLVNKRA